MWPFQLKSTKTISVVSCSSFAFSNCASAFTNRHFPHAAKHNFHFIIQDSKLCKPIAHKKGTLSPTPHTATQSTLTHRLLLLASSRLQERSDASPPHMWPDSPISNSRPHQYLHHLLGVDGHRPGQVELLVRILSLHRRGSGWPHIPVVEVPQAPARTRRNTRKQKTINHSNKQPDIIVI